MKRSPTGCRIERDASLRVRFQPLPSRFGSARTQVCKKTYHSIEFGASFDQVTSRGVV